MSNLPKAERRKEIKKIVEGWQQSGLTQKHYCERENIPMHLFKYWWGKSKGTGEKKKTVASPPAKKRFIALDLQDSPGKDDSSDLLKGLAIEYPNGVKLHCPDGLEFTQMKALITLF